MRTADDFIAACKKEILELRKLGIGVPKSVDNSIERAAKEYFDSNGYSNRGVTECVDLAVMCAI